MKQWIWFAVFMFVMAMVFTPSYPVDASVETLDDRVRKLENHINVLERTILACCTSQSKPDGIDQDQEVAVTLRREFRKVSGRLEEIEWRYMNQDRPYLDSKSQQIWRDSIEAWERQEEIRDELKRQERRKQWQN